jgi:flagellar motor switch protein FliN
MGLLDQPNDQITKPVPPARNPVDVLMQVEVPVSVSLGRTKMRMKDLLSLTHGSVVELDEYVGDEVEILVNKCVLAHGEVVAVDGNYGVRITRLGNGSAPIAAPGSPSPVSEGLSPEDEP